MKERLFSSVLVVVLVSVTALAVGSCNLGSSAGPTVSGIVTLPAGLVDMGGVAYPSASYKLYVAAVTEGGPDSSGVYPLADISDALVSVTVAYNALSGNAVSYQLTVPANGNYFVGAVLDVDGDGALTVDEAPTEPAGNYVAGGNSPALLTVTGDIGGINFDVQDFYEPPLPPS